MLRRRESRSAAAATAAVAAWPLGPLALALALFSTMPHGALSRGLVLPPLPPPLLHQTCDNVPYPFGLRNVSLPGFAVTCGPNNEAMLPIGEDSYRIDHVSVPEGFVIIFAGPIRQVCYDRHGSPTPTTGTGQMSLERTPFSFSKRNKLVATGCNCKLFANFTNQPTSDTSCSTWCTGSSNAINNRSCSDGRACCEAPMPMEMDGARDFTLTFERTPEKFTGEEDGTCSAAFFLDQDEQVFTGGADGWQRPLKDALSRTGDRRMILDWAIGLVTCDQARSYSFEPPYCNGNPCIDAPSGAGYRCICNAGYDGNPYVRDGCVGSPMQQPQGLDVCNHPERNPCMYSKYCIDGQGAVSCACPPGMSGDGRKKGSGCRIVDGNQRGVNDCNV